MLGKMFGGSKDKKGKKKKAEAAEAVKAGVQEAKPAPSAAEAPAPHPDAPPAQPAPAAPEASDGAPALPTEWEALEEMGMKHCAALQEANDGLWGMREAENWGVDLNTGEITFVLPDKVAKAAVDVIGSWDVENEIFLWGWANDSVPQNRAVAAAKAKAYGEAHGIRQLTDPRMQAGRDGCWRLVAPAALVADLKGVYRAETVPGKTWVYLGFGDVTLSQREANA